MVQTDNKAARSMVEKFRGTPTHMPLIREVLALCLRLDVRLSAHWIGTKENVLADAASRAEWARFRAYAASEFGVAAEDLDTSDVREVLAGGASHAPAFFTRLVHFDSNVIGFPYR